MMVLAWSGPGQLVRANWQPHFETYVVTLKLRDAQNWLVGDNLIYIDFTHHDYIFTLYTPSPLVSFSVFLKLISSKDNV